MNKRVEMVPDYLLGVPPDVGLGRCSNKVFL